MAVLHSLHPRQKEKSGGDRVKDANEECGECAKCLENCPGENIDGESDIVHAPEVVFEPSTTDQTVKISRFWFDKICIVGFPALYIIFNVSYWSYYV